VITAMPRIAIDTDDFESALRTFGETFGLPVVDLSERTVPALGAHVAMCVPPGGSNIELMSPADPTKPLSQALATFLRRRGDGLYALMLEAPDPDAEAVELSARGLDVLPLMAGAGGRDIHPRSTHGVLIRVYPDDSAALGHHESGPLGLSGILRVIIATDDASLAAKVYGEGLGLDVDPVVLDQARGVLSARCRAPKGGDIELVSPADSSRPFGAAIERVLAEQPGGMYALVLQAPDPAEVVRKLTAAGVPAGRTTGRDVVVHGARFLVEQRDEPQR
jgi:catechol 2,3-dioxygenase-like lactoylglutathione lyase family enzyme